MLNTNFLLKGFSIYCVKYQFFCFSLFLFLSFIHSSEPRKQFPKSLKVVVFPKSRAVVNNTNVLKSNIFHEIDVRFTEILAEAIGFSYEVIIPSDGEIGRLLSNGTWTGTIGVMQRKDADLIGGIIMSLERTSVIEFSFPIQDIPVIFATRKPKYHPDPVALLKPFSFETWICIIACFFILPCLFHKLLHKKHTIVDLFFLTYGIFLQNSVSIKLKGASDYVLALFTMSGTMFLCYGYMAVLLSFLSFPTLKGVCTIPELSAAVSEGRYRCIGAPGTSTVSYLLKSNNPNHRVIGQSMKDNKGSMNIDDVLESNESPKISAYITAFNNLLPLKAKYFVSQETFYFTWLAAGVQKDFCCKVALDYAITNIWGSGIFSKIAEEIIFKFSLEYLFSSDANVTIKERQLSMQELKGIFIVLLLGHTMACIVFLLELMHGKVNRMINNS